MDDRPNFATFEDDEVTGLPFIICVTTKQRLYKMPLCRICESVNYSYQNTLKLECGQCRPDRLEANDLDELLA